VDKADRMASALRGPRPAMRTTVFAVVVAAALLAGPTHASEQQPAPADQLAVEVGSVDAVQGELESNSGMSTVIGFKRSNSLPMTLISRRGPVRRNARGYTGGLRHAA